MLTAAAHSFVATLRRAHGGKEGYDAASPVHATAATGAAVSSPRQQHGAPPSYRGRRDNGRQGRSGDSYNFSRDGDGSSQALYRPLCSVFYSRGGQLSTVFSYM